MKNLIKISSKIVALLIIVMLTSARLHAQPNPGPGNQGNATSYTTDGPTVPFDGGMSLMFAASGIAYASKKLKKNKSTHENGLIV